MRKRNNFIGLRLSDGELAMLNEKARKAGINREAYLRFLINGYAPKAVPPPDYFSMMRELHAIGNNIHQVAARANATGFFMKDEYALYIEDFRNAVKRIQAAVTFPEEI